MTSEAVTETEKAFEEAIDSAFDESKGSYNSWQAKQGELKEHHPLCTVVDTWRYVEDDSSCPSGKRVWEITSYICDGVPKKRKRNYCQT